MLQINAMSDAEREQLEYMLEKLGVKKKWIMIRESEVFYHPSS
jgi:hypothetical protein